MDNKDISEHGEQLQLIDVPTQPESAGKVLTITFVAVTIGIALIYFFATSITKSPDFKDLNLSAKSPDQPQQQQQVAGAANGPQQPPPTAQPSKNLPSTPTVAAVVTTAPNSPTSTPTPTPQSPTATSVPPTPTETPVPPTDTPVPPTETPTLTPTPEE